MTNNFASSMILLIPDLADIPEDALVWKRAESRFLALGKLAGPETMPPGVWLNELVELKRRANLTILCTKFGDS